jgi:hypothetical protein
MSENKSVGERFVDLLEQSVIVQALITLTLVATMCVIVAQNRDVPQLLSDSVLLVLGYYFGSKNNMMISRITGRRD